MTSDADVLSALGGVTSELPGGGEERRGQQDMASAVSTALRRREHLIVQAGTGTGKSLAYLVPSILSGRRTVVATATKALQDQLANKDLPFLDEHLDHPFSWAILKGRANYVCLQRLDEIAADANQLSLEVGGSRRSTDEIAKIRDWSTETASGDRAELDFEPSGATWAAVSVGPRECPGASKCPRGDGCFAEQARRRAAEADVVVVNTHLYGLHLATGRGVLPDHDLVVFDEAHHLEDTVSATAGTELSAGRFEALSRTAGALIEDDTLREKVGDAGVRFADAAADHIGRRLRGRLPEEIAEAVLAGRAVCESVLAAARSVSSDKADVQTRKARLLAAAGALADDLDRVLGYGRGEVAWIEGDEASPRLRVAPVDVAETLRTSLWAIAADPDGDGSGSHASSVEGSSNDARPPVAVLTSATIPPLLGDRLGLPASAFTELDVGSPFDFETNATLYCATHLPDPRHADFEAASHDELQTLIEAAGGRTLALFTSHRAMNAAADALEERISQPVLRQDQLPKAVLVDRFADEAAVCLFATVGFFEGIDVPGPALSLVTIDKLPFPRPDDPLLQARREAAREHGFRQVDLSRAATLLAQGAGRLIRRSDDRGVVAVFDKRLSSANYRWEIIRALPPMRRTKDRAEVLALLRTLDQEATTAGL